MESTGTHASACTVDLNGVPGGSSIYLQRGTGMESRPGRRAKRDRGAATSAYCGASAPTRRVYIRIQPMRQDETRKKHKDHVPHRRFGVSRLADESGERLTGAMLGLCRLRWGRNGRAARR